MSHLIGEAPNQIPVNAMLGDLAYQNAKQVLSNFTEKVDVPTTATSTGKVGQFAFDAAYLYVCIDTDTWMRTAIATWI